MTTLDSKHRSLTIPSSSGSDLEPAHWLIVLVPYLEADLSIAMHRIWELANVGDRRVRFIGLYKNQAQELSLRRQLVHMSAMVNTGGVFTETEVIFWNNWEEIVRLHWHASDLVVCFEEQLLGRSGRSLSDILQSDLNIPVYILSGLYTQKHMPSNWITQIIVWAGFIAIILGFFLLQVKMDHLTTDWTHIVLPLLSIPFELWMILAWNRLFE